MHYSEVINNFNKTHKLNEEKLFNQCPIRATEIIRVDVNCFIFRIYTHYHGWLSIYDGTLKEVLSFIKRHKYVLPNKPPSAYEIIPKSEFLQKYF